MEKHEFNARDSKTGCHWRAQASEDGRVKREPEEHDVAAVAEDGIKSEHNVYETESSHVEEHLQIGPTVLQPRHPPVARPEFQCSEVKLEPRSPEGETSQEDLTSVCSASATAAPPAGLQWTKGSHKHKRTDRKRVTCNICKGKYTDLTRHMRVHTGETPFSCNTCDAKFSEGYTLKMHMRLHTGEKPFSCTTCDAKFTHRSSLKAHKFIHTGERPYSCTTCDAKFTDRSSLKKHTLKHSGEKLFSCTTCDVKFARRRFLNMHMRTHTVEKPFSYTTCHINFTQLGNLKSPLDPDSQTLESLLKLKSGRF